MPIRASGPPDDDVTAKADAIRVATEIKAFASFGGPSQTTAYADELAARGVLCVGDCTIAAPESFLESRAPYIWPTLASPDQAAEHWAAFVGKELSGRRAKFAGDPALRRQKRRFGVVRYDDEPGTFDQSFARFAALLKDRGVDIATQVPYQLDLGSAQENARASIAALREAGVTSVILAGDPVFPAFLTREATAQGYFPEWVVMGYAYTDTAVFGRQYDQQQWRHAFGVSLLPTRQADDIDELASVLVWQTGRGPIAKTFRLLVQAPLLFFTGVHLAGPDLTPETFRDGLFRYPAVRPTSSPFLHLSWGRHDIWPGVDLTGGDDAAVIWWDPNASGPDEVGNDGTGLWRYARRGARYLPDTWPDGDVGLYDDATSVTILRTLPPDARPTRLSLAGVVLDVDIDPALTRDEPADDPRRVAHRDTEVGQHPGDDRPGTHDDMTSDRGAREHDGAVPEPARVADRDRTRRGELLTRRHVDIDVPVVGVGDVHVVAGEHVVADHDTLVRHDPAPAPDQAPVTEANDLDVAELVARGHPRRQGDVRTDHGRRADRDVPLAVERGDREADRAARAERPEALRSSAPVTDDGPTPCALPRSADRRAGDAAEETHQVIRAGR